MTEEQSWSARWVPDPAHHAALHDKHWADPTDWPLWMYSAHTPLWVIKLIAASAFIILVVAQFAAMVLA